MPRKPAPPVISTRRPGSELAWAIVSFPRPTRPRVVVLVARRAPGGGRRATRSTQTRNASRRHRRLASIVLGPDDRCPPREPLAPLAPLVLHPAEGPLDRALPVAVEPVARALVQRRLPGLVGAPVAAQVL